MSKSRSEPEYYVSRINTQVLNYHVYVMSRKEKILYVALLFVSGGAVGLIFYGGLFQAQGQATFLTYMSNAVVFTVAGIFANQFLLPMFYDSLKKKRRNQLKHQFCDFAAALTNALASGMNMTDSLEAVERDLEVQYSEDACIVQEVKEIINGMKNNIPIEIMLEDFGVRSGVEDITNFSVVFATCYRTGGDLKSVVSRTTEIISEKMMISSEIETAITSNKLQMNIMNVIPVVIVFMMRLMNQAFAESFGSIVGIVGLTISLGLTLGAYKMGQKIMDVRG